MVVVVLLYHSLTHFATLLKRWWAPRTLMALFAGALSRVKVKFNSSLKVNWKIDKLLSLYSRWVFALVFWIFLFFLCPPEPPKRVTQVDRVEHALEALTNGGTVTTATTRLLECFAQVLAVAWWPLDKGNFKIGIYFSGRRNEITFTFYLFFVSVFRILN